MSIVIPSLSPAGWIKDPKTQMTTMLAHAIVANNLQTVIYRGNVTSLSYLVATYQDNVDTMVNAIEEALKTYYGRVFPIVDISVTASDASSGRYQLYIVINVTVENQTYNLSTEASIDNGVLKTTLGILNQ